MGEEEVLKFHEVHHCPKILLQRAEEIFPVLKEGMVSVVCMK
jgi:hypothetical protein